MEQYFDVSEFAKLIHYSERSVRKMIKNEKISAQRISGSRKWLIPIDELDRFKEEAEKELRSELKSEKATSVNASQLTRSYDEERFSDSDKIMNEKDLARLLNKMQSEYYYSITDYQKIIRWVSFFNLKSNDYYDQEIGRLCSQLSDSAIELIIFMKLEFIKTKQKSIYTLTYNNRIGKQEETLAYKIVRLEELINTLRKNYSEYNAVVSERFNL